MTSKRKIVVVESEVKKNKKYLPLKNEIPYCLNSDTSTWFTFSNQGLYHPIGIIDENNQFVTVSSSVEMLVSLLGDTSRDYKVCAKNRKGIYWFSAIKAHVTGKVILRFSVPDDMTIEPLESVSIIVDENGTPVVTQTADEIAEIAELVDNSFDSQHVPLVVEDDDAVGLLRSTRSSKRKKDVESSGNIAYDAADTLAEVQTTATDQQNKSFLLSNYCQSIQEVSQSDPLPSKHRLERKWKINNNKSFSAVSLTDTMSKLKLPLALFRALLYDKEVVSPLVCSCWRELQSGFRNLKRKRNSQQESFKRLMSPSVYDLFKMLQSRFKVPYNTIRFLLYIFETKAFSIVLYEDEQNTFAEYLNESKDQKRFISQFFGPYYFLRFIVAIGCEGPLHEIHKVVENSIRFLDEQFHSIFF